MSRFSQAYRRRTTAAFLTQRSILLGFTLILAATAIWILHDNHGELRNYPLAVHGTVVGADDDGFAHVRVSAPPARYPDIDDATGKSLPYETFDVLYDKDMPAKGTRVTVYYSHRWDDAKSAPTIHGDRVDDRVSALLLALSVLTIAFIVITYAVTIHRAIRAGHGLATVIAEAILLVVGLAMAAGSMWLWLWEATR